MERPRRDDLEALRVIAESALLILGGTLLRWTGGGWVAERDATADDRRKYPELEFKQEETQKNGD